MAALKVPNIARGGKGLRSEVRGVKELERKLKQLATTNPGLTTAIRVLVGQASADVRNEMKSRAISAGWASKSISTRKGTVLATGQEVIDSMFASARPAPGDDPRRRVSGLAGVSKRRSMVEWIAGRVGPQSWPTRTPRRVKAGGLVAEAFATMLEFGTTRMKPRPAIVPAIQAARGRVVATLTEGYNDLLVKYSK